MTVVFEHIDYRRYRLQTNNLVRTGELMMETGFADDAGATVYVLKEAVPTNDPMRLVHLSTEPTRVYSVSASGELLLASALELVVGGSGSFEGEGTNQSLFIR